ncbi:Striatin-Interacting Protein 2 [Manis pentadactyla]|nr:Striatin-Interacting Protein 2 [Manis pentadactyla]
MSGSKAPCIGTRLKDEPLPPGTGAPNSRALLVSAERGKFPGSLPHRPEGDVRKDADGTCARIPAADSAS